MYMYILYTWPKRGETRRGDARQGEARRGGARRGDARRRRSKRRQWSERRREEKRNDARQARRARAGQSGGGARGGGAGEGGRGEVALESRLQLSRGSAIKCERRVDPVHRRTTDRSHRHQRCLATTPRRPTPPRNRAAAASAM